METQTLNTKKPPRDFRLVLQQAFVDRCRKNPNYSLRAFARALGIGASPLSAILRGKRPITEKMKSRLGLALGMKLHEIETFTASENHLNTNFQQITLDTYAIISDWYHYAILELIKVKGFKPEISYVAKTLGLTKTEVQIAAERLQRVGLLEIEKSGKWIDTATGGFATNISEDLTSNASIKLQKQILELSMKALEELPVSDRNHTSMTMAANPEDLPEARKRIKAFRRSLCIFLERNQTPTQVYHLGISLYPVTKDEEK